MNDGVDGEAIDWPTYIGAASPGLVVKRAPYCAGIAQAVAEDVSVGKLRGRAARGQRERKRRRPRASDGNPHVLSPRVGCLILGGLRRRPADWENSKAKPQSDRWRSTTGRRPALLMRHEEARNERVGNFAVAGLELAIRGALSLLKHLARFSRCSRPSLRRFRRGPMRRRRTCRAASAAWPTSAASSSSRRRTSPTHGSGRAQLSGRRRRQSLGRTRRPRRDRFRRRTVPAGRRHQPPRVAPRRSPVRAVRRAGPGAACACARSTPARARASTRRMRRSRSPAPGSYRVDVSADREHTRVVVREGEANVLTPGAVQQVLPGQSAYVDGAGSAARRACRTASASTASTPGPRAAIGSTCAASTTSYVSPQMVGAADLDQYGTWSQAPEYGAVWYPNDVAADWAPYRNGYWVDVGGWGPTWVDYAPWGYAPFHYGRWAYIGGRWGWCPGRATSRGRVWAPALVAWTGGPGWALSASDRRPGLRLGAARLGRAVPAVVGPLLVRLLGPLQPAVRGEHAVWRPNGPAPTRYANWNAPNGVTAVQGPSLVTHRPVQQNLVRVPRDALATAPVLAGAPAVRMDPARVSAGRPGNSVPPPASTFYPTNRPAYVAPTGTQGGTAQGSRPTRTIQSAPPAGTPATAQGSRSAPGSPAPFGTQTPSATAARRRAAVRHAEPPVAIAHRPASARDAAAHERAAATPGTGRRGQCAGVACAVAVAAARPGCAGGAPEPPGAVVRADADARRSGGRPRAVAHAGHPAAAFDDAPSSTAGRHAPGAAGPGGAPGTGPAVAIAGAFGGPVAAACTADAQRAVAAAAGGQRRRQPAPGRSRRRQRAKRRPGQRQLAGPGPRRALIWPAGRPGAKPSRSGSRVTSDSHPRPSGSAASRGRMPSLAGETACAPLRRSNDAHRAQATTGTRIRRRRCRRNSTSSSAPGRSGSTKRRAVRKRTAERRRIRSARIVGKATAAVRTAWRRGAAARAAAIGPGRACGDTAVARRHSHDLRAFDGEGGASHPQRTDERSVSAKTRFFPRSLGPA